MMHTERRHINLSARLCRHASRILIASCLACAPLCMSAQEPEEATISQHQDGLFQDLEVEGFETKGDSIEITSDELIPVAKPFDKFAGYNEWEEREDTYNPDPTRAVWMSALCPGLGQVYNRRYWKLPIVVGGYLGLAYATSWNNTMLTDYTRAYRDIMDTDPTTTSYMDFFPPTVNEADLDKTWLTKILQSRRNYFRRNRDLCIICMVGVYLLAMVDAYVDASLSHFDISTDLSMDITPTLIRDSHSRYPSLGMQWAFNF